MSEGLELVLESLAIYWTSSLPLAVLTACGACMGTLLYVFLANARNAKLRVSLLTGFYGLTVFFWLFIAVSLALCVWQARMVAYRTWGVQAAASGALLAALASSFGISFVVWRYGNARLLHRFAPIPVPREYGWLRGYVDLLTKFEGLPPVEAGFIDSKEPLAMAIGGKAPHVLLSRGLLEGLDRDEIETVVTHELMHLKNHDAGFKVFSTVLSRILIFDPFSKFFDPAVHREREYLADEMSGRSTRKPAALASALLKISKLRAPRKSAWGISILGPGTGLFSRYPPLEKRVERLLLLSYLLGDGS